MIGWKFESGKTLNRGHREKTANQKRKGSSKKTPVQRSAQYQTKGETMKEVEENRSAAYERGKEDALRGYSPQEGAEAYIEGYLTEASWPLYLKQRAPRYSGVRNTKRKGTVPSATDKARRRQKYSRAVNAGIFGSSRPGERNFIEHGGQYGL